MTIRVLLLLVALALVPKGSYAYEPTTHEDMSEAAAFSSLLAKPETLSALGLTGGIDDPRLTFPNSEGKEKAIKFLIRDGANFEDNFPRPLNHFFDPLTGKGLGLGSPSPDWALEDQASYTSQDNSYKDARGYFYDALAKAGSTRAERDVDWGKLFQSLGQIIHHIHDMAQPQHVRNDDHCDQWYCVGPFNCTVLLMSICPPVPFPATRALRKTSSDGPRQAKAHGGDRPGDVPLHRGESRAGGSLWVGQAP